MTYGLPGSETARITNVLRGSNQSQDSKSMSNHGTGQSDVRATCVSAAFWSGQADDGLDRVLDSERCAPAICVLKFADSVK